MKITCEWFPGQNPQFNMSLASAEGREPFLVVKGARIVPGKNGPFISWPSRKKDDGTYWNHVWSSEAFSQAVLEEAMRSQPKQDTRTHGEQRRGATADPEIPF